MKCPDCGETLGRDEEIEDLKEYKKMWQSVGGRANLKGMIQKIEDAEKVIKKYQTHFVQGNRMAEEYWEKYGK